MAASTTKINELLNEAQDWDKDKRFMAANDLCAELLKEGTKLDVSLEKRICSAFLKQLDDASVDVQGNAVKCLAKIVSRVQESQVGEVVSKLVQLILEGKAEFRDIYATCLKGLIAEVPESFGHIICNQLTVRLVKGVGQGDLVDVKEECADILAELLRRFGAAAVSAPEKESAMRALLSQLTGSRHALRKRCTACIGALAVVLADRQLHTLIQLLLDLVRTLTVKEDLHTVIQTIGTISRTVGYRLGRHLDQLIPLFFGFCQPPQQDENADLDRDNELIENCLQAFESFVLRCPKEVTPYVNQIVNLAIDLVSYDPNYNYDMVKQDTMEEEDWGDEYSDGGDTYSDDDDSSWKVRRAAVRLISSLIKSRPELLSQFYSRVTDVLTDRFKEREENVKLDIFSVFVDLLRSTVIGSMVGESTVSNASAPAGQTTLVRQRSSADLIHQRIQAIMDGLLKQLQTASVKTRSGVTAVLKEVASVMPEAFVHYLSRLMPEIKKNFSDSNSALKIETLKMLRLAMRVSDVSVFQQFAEPLSHHIVHGITDSYYKITAEALRLCAVFIHTLRPSKESSFDFRPFVNGLFSAVNGRLVATDIDQEVKESAILSMGELLAVFGDVLTAEIPSTLPLILERLRNEVTRVAAVKTLARISDASVDVDLRPILSDSIVELCTFLHKQSRSLKQLTLDTLSAVISKNGSYVAVASQQQVLLEAAPFIADSDLHLAHQALDLVTLILVANAGASADIIREHILPPAMSLGCSALLQGLALQSLLNFFASLVKLNLPGMGFDQLMNNLLNRVYNGADLSKQSLSTAAQCVAALSMFAPSDKQQATVAKLMTDLQGSPKESIRLLALLCVGELGHRVDLSPFGDLRSLVYSLFDSPSEEIKTAASFALGNFAVGNLAASLPFLLNETRTNQKRLYLLLLSLKEVIAQHALRADRATQLKPHVEQILPMLLEHCRSEEEGVRNLVAECMGRLGVIDPDRVIPMINSQLHAESPLIRSTVTTAIRFAFSKQVSPAALQSLMSDYLATLNDLDLNVRRASLLTLNTITHTLPHLLRFAAHDAILPLLFQETVPKPELVREVDLGPFKHKVDDGLALRKAAFSCIETMLDAMPERIDTTLLADRLRAGLEDQDDVQVLCHQILVKLCSWSPGAILGSLDQLIEPLERTVNQMVKQVQNKQEIERATDILRSALRAVDAMSRVPDADSNNKFAEFVPRILKLEKVRELYQLIQQHQKDIA
eukprot:GILK01003157.1.p1 GENE.GILK01003157.1~~GILK01003157.1.p1  ORF type:complete len:1261 (+),score=324.06 GILK01003157.1:67-3783(+)